MYTKLEESTENVLGYSLGEQITKQEFRELSNSLEQAIDETGRIRLLLDLDRLKGVHPGAVLEHLKFTLRRAGKIERMAVVGNRTWEKWWPDIHHCFAKAELKHFGEAELQDAWSWLRGLH
ncbi:MAG: hypothetical protein B7Z66_06450 [Chromatiales bacterium 21-64-14]|nr:MAG: hypothetical protein B7Z66_06450 [Chromatiales bacterium 21-64-14]HQU16943.1 STAS/SEC14 domain-containing protein [Gammaproteobacteria bacterium]